MKTESMPVKYKIRQSYSLIFASVLGVKKVKRRMRVCNLCFSCVVPVTVFFLSLFSVVLQAEPVTEYIAIRKEGASRISIIVDKTRATGVKESAWADQLDGTITGALDFTGIFTVLPAPATIRPVADGTLDFGVISSSGADILVNGSVSYSSGKLALEMQVRDSAGKLLLNRKYIGTESNLRQIGLRFSADMVELLTGKRSLFDSTIVFVSNRTGYKEIYQCDFDGRNIRQLTGSRSISLTPALSRDGKYLAWTDYSSGRPDLYIRNLSTNMTISVKKQGVCISPAWRPGTAECATTLSHEGDQDIYLLRTDGSVVRRLTKGNGIDVSPTFSPDGSKMAFVSSREGGPQIFIQNLDTRDVRRLTFSGSYNTQPSWSPAGDKILYSSLQKNNEINIFVIDVDGSGLMQLTGGTRNNEYPCWSPDARMIIFSSNREGRRKLYVMNADGANQRPLLDLAGDQQQPSWAGSY